MGRILTREFYCRQDTLAVARDLLGKRLAIREKDGKRTSGRIVELEAYQGETDRAAHSFGGKRTPRTEVMFGPGGFSYVFLVYGMYHQFNVVTGPEEWPHVILIRALDPIENLDVMKRRRGTDVELNLTSGPGKLCIALGIDKSFYGEDLMGDRVLVEEDVVVPKENIRKGPRIGIDYAGSDALKPWRFWIDGNPNVSR